MKCKLIFVLAAACVFISRAQTFNGTTGLVSDDGANNDFTANVSGLSSTSLGSSLGLLTVCINMTHTYDSDMEFRLIAPDGTDITLFNGVGGADDDFTNTCLDMSAGTNITAGLAPFTGSFKPMSNLGDVNNGQNGNGTWILRCIDHYGQDQGNLLSWAITFGSNAPVPYPFTGTNLPLVVINTSGQSIPDEPKIAANMKIIYNGAGQMNHLTDVPNVYDGDIGIEERGAFSASLPQKPWGFETRLPSGLERDTSLLGMPSEHDWVLLANYNDKAFVRNTLAYKLFTEMNHYAPRMRHCEVFLNGQYQGIYLLGEKIKRDNGRVDIAKLDTFENVAPDITGGYILKNDYYDGTNSWQSPFSPIDHPGLDVHFVYYYPTPDKITPQQKTYIQNFINDLETALYSPTFTDTVNGYKKYISETSFHDYFIVNELARNVDGFKKSRYFHKEKDSAGVLGKLKAGPVWDFDWAWKNIWDCSYFQATDGSGWSHLINDCGPDVNSNGWYVRLLQDSNYANRLRCRYENLRNTILDTAYLFNYIDSVALHLDSAQIRHYNKWGHLGLNSGAPEVGTIPTSFQGEVDALKDWIRLRITWLDANMPGSLNGCLFTGTDLQVKEEVTMNLFPNPANDKVSLDLKALPAYPCHLNFYDVSGRLVGTRTLPAGKLNDSFDVSFLGNGVYFVKVQCGRFNACVKLLVQHN